MEWMHGRRIVCVSREGPIDSLNVYFHRWSFTINNHTTPFQNREARFAD